MILIITNKLDPHADTVIRNLNKLNVKFIRINTEDFPQHASVTWELDGNNSIGTLRLYNMHSLKLSEITACWYRRPDPPKVSSELKTKSTKKFAQEESDEFLKGLWRYLEDRFWINYPSLVKQADHKMYNLYLASKVGFTIPKTIITTDPKSANIFIDKYRENVIIKTLSSVLLNEPKDVYYVYSHKIVSQDKDRLDSVVYAPTQMQEYIDKKLEIRTTIVGKKVFSCEIHSQDSEKTKIDWRHYDFKNVKHLPHQLPKDIEEKLLKMLNILGLNYGAFDLILTPEGKYVFLELNPNGQYLWIEHLTKMPISTAIAELLVKGSKQYSTDNS